MQTACELMQVSEIRLMADPSLIVPSESQLKSIDFYVRLMEWCGDERMRVGPNTYSGFEAWVSELYEGRAMTPRGITIPDLMRSLSPMFSRVIERTTRPSCRGDVSIEPLYEGGIENLKTLKLDLAATDEQSANTLASHPQFWREGMEPFAVPLQSGEHLWIASTPHEPLSAYIRQFCDKNLSALRDLEKYAQDAFPKLRFSDTAWNSIATLEGKPRDLLVEVVRHLAVLNDKAPGIWEREVNQVSRIYEMHLFGVECSPESPKTRANNKAIKERQFIFSGSPVQCEWHTKIEWNRNRIHFSVCEDEVLIGCFSPHLAT